MAKAKPVETRGKKIEILNAIATGDMTMSMSFLLASAGKVIGIERREKLVVGSYPRTAMATEDMGLKPIATSKGGNNAGVTTPSELRKDPKPTPMYRARISSPTTCCLMTFETVSNAPASLMRKISSIVAETDIEMPKLFTKPYAVDPNATSIGVPNWETAKIIVNTKPAKAMVKPL
jgi:hypothetical protein